MREGVAEEVSTAKPTQATRGSGQLYLLFAIVVVGTSLGGLTQAALNTVASTSLLFTGVRRLNSLSA